MTVRNFLRDANQELNKNNIDDGILKARMILENCLNVSKEYLMIHDDIQIPQDKEEKLNEQLERLKNGEPVQYIVNKAEFMGINFYVDENVLIPQPDTEMLVENVIEIVRKLQQASNGHVKILDLCTGSGAIAVSLCKNLQNVKVFASDISEPALEIAKENAIANNCYIEFVKSDLFQNINEKFNVIVSNPPYIETDVIKTLSSEVKKEPKIALDGGSDGLDFYRKIIPQARDYLKEKGYLCVEIGYNQCIEVKNLYDKNCFGDVEIKKDLNEINRVIMGRM